MVRRLVVRAGICAAITLAMGSVQGCSSSTRAPTSTGRTTTGAPSTPLDAAGFPTELHLEPERVFLAFLDTEYGDRSASRWYLGSANSQSGPTIRLEIEALAATSDEASRYCTAIAGPAAFFMPGLTYALVVGGEVKVASPATPGVVTFQLATFTPVSCPKPSGSTVDPMRANEPRTASDAIDRLERFAGNYYDRVGASGGDSWYAGSAYGGIGTKIVFDVRDRTTALGLERCDTVRPLAAWLLGPFARQFTLQVRGMNGTGSTSWAAVDCPS